MKLLTLIVSVMAGLSTFAFDVESWKAKRAEIERDAVRLAQAYTNCVATTMQPSECAVIPIETFDDGSIKVKIEARKAWFFAKEGMVLGEDVKICRYDSDGVETTRLEAKSCLVDRNSKSGWASGEGRLTHGESVFVGEDIYFSSSRMYTAAFKSAQIDSTDLKFGGGL